MLTVAPTFLVPPRADTSHPHSYANGHLSPSSAYTNGAHTPSSDSDLSDVSEHLDPATIRVSNAAIDRANEAYDNNDSLSSEDEDALGSEDADYEIEDAAMDMDAVQESQSSSQDSRRSLKRKSTAQEEDYMRNDPELYGIRRSVSI